MTNERLEGEACVHGDQGWAQAKSLRSVHPYCSLKRVARSRAEWIERRGEQGGGDGPGRWVSQGEGAPLATQLVGVGGGAWGCLNARGAGGKGATGRSSRRQWGSGEAVSKGPPVG